MALVGPEMKAKLESRIHEGLKRVFSSEVSGGTGYSAVADAQWAKMADAISDIALDIVNEIQQNAEVVPGIAVATTGSASAQAGATVAPGKII
jgi:hypothetical protein